MSYLQLKILQEVDKNCGQELGFFEKSIHSKGRADWFINAEESLQLGMADIIGNPNLILNFNVNINFKF